MAVGAVDHVILNRQILIDELCGVVVIGSDATDFGSGKENVFRAIGGEEGIDGWAVCQVEICSGSSKDVSIAALAQGAVDCAASQSQMASNKDR